MAKRKFYDSAKQQNAFGDFDTPKPKAKPRRDESAAQKVLIWKVTELMHKHPCLRWLYAIPNEAGASNMGRKFIAEGLKRGVSDLCLPYPRAQFHGLYIEMKLPGKHLTDEQLAFKTFVEQNGYYACVCNTWEEAYCEIDDYCSMPDFGNTVFIPKL